MYGYKKMTTCDGIKLAVSWERQDNRGIRRETDLTPKKEESTDVVGPALCTRHQLMLSIWDDLVTTKMME